MKEVTATTVLKALRAATRRLAADKTLLSASESAGFVIPAGQPKGQQEGVQVFVGAYRYSDRVAARSPSSGGLLAREREIGEGR